MALHPCLREQIFARIFGRNGLEFFHQVAHALVHGRRHDYLDFDVLVAARAVAGTGHAFFFQAQRLAAVCRRRDAHERAAVDRGDFDFCAQRGFAHRDRNFGVQIVAAAFEERMRLYVHAQIQIAWGRAHGSCVAFARDADAAATGYASGDAHVDRFGAAQTAFAAARWADLANFAGAAAARAGNVEFHFAGSLLDGPRAVAGRAGLRGADGARAVARFAGVEARDGQFFDGAADGIPKVDFDLIFKIAARLVFRFLAAAAPAAEKLAEEIAETRVAALCSRAAAKIKAVEIEIDTFPVLLPSSPRTAGRNVVAVEAVLVVHLAFFRVGEDVVGFLQLLEFFLAGFIAGVEIGMVFAREFAESRANIFRVGLLRDP